MKYYECLISSHVGRAVALDPASGGGPAGESALCLVGAKGEGGENEFLGVLLMRSERNSDSSLKTPMKYLYSACLFSFGVFRIFLGVSAGGGRGTKVFQSLE